MNYQRRRITDSQHTQRRTVARWPLAMLHGSAIVLAIQIAAWFVLAINGSPYRLVVLMSMSQAAIVWCVAMAWSIKELR